jgi:hypothetical protein
MPTLSRPPRGRNPPFNRMNRAYAIWTLRDGSEILTTRRYEPIAQRRPGEPGHPIPWQFFDNIAHEQWLETPAFPQTRAGNRDCEEWHNDMLARFLKGDDMRRYLQRHPVKLYSAGSIIYIDKDGAHYSGKADKPEFHKAPEKISPAWLNALKVAASIRPPPPPPTPAECAQFWQAMANFVRTLPPVPPPLH